MGAAPVKDRPCSTDVPAARVGRSELQIVMTQCQCLNVRNASDDTEVRGELGANLSEHEDP
jgi:hypothetical protein